MSNLHLVWQLSALIHLFDDTIATHFNTRHSLSDVEVNFLLEEKTNEYSSIVKRRAYILMSEPSQRFASVGNDFSGERVR